jgi:hypothetical protein
MPKGGEGRADGEGWPNAYKARNLNASGSHFSSLHHRNSRPGMLWLCHLGRDDLYQLAGLVAAASNHIKQTESRRRHSPCTSAFASSTARDRAGHPDCGSNLHASDDSPAGPCGASPDPYRGARDVACQHQFVANPSAASQRDPGASDVAYPSPCLADHRSDTRRHPAAFHADSHQYARTDWQRVHS